MHDEQRYMIRLAGGEEFGPAGITVLEQWAREGRVPADAMLVPSDGGDASSVLSRPELARVLQHPPTHRGTAPAAEPAGDDAIATLIPYRNGPALAGYYLAVASLVPMAGALAGPAAICLGVVGLRRRRADPRCRGAAHAWVAIVLGAIGTLISVACISGFAFALAANR